MIRLSSRDTTLSSAAVSRRTLASKFQIGPLPRIDSSTLDAVCDLVRAADEVEVHFAQELRHDVLAEGEGHTPVVLAPTHHVLVRVRPASHHPVLESVSVFPSTRISRSRVFTQSPDLFEHDRKVLRKAAGRAAHVTRALDVRPSKPSQQLSIRPTLSKFNAEFLFKIRVRGTLGLDHSKSQSNPVSGTSVGRMIFLIWSICCSSGDKPPWPTEQRTRSRRETPRLLFFPCFFSRGARAHARKKPHVLHKTERARETRSRTHTHHTRTHTRELVCKLLVCSSIRDTKEVGGKPWRRCQQQKIFSSTMAATGRQLKQSVNVFHILML